MAVTHLATEMHVPCHGHHLGIPWLFPRKTIQKWDAGSPLMQDLHLTTCIIMSHKVLLSED
jgi:hypothetical protein